MKHLKNKHLKSKQKCWWSSFSLTKYIKRKNINEFDVNLKEDGYMLKNMEFDNNNVREEWRRGRTREDMGMRIEVEHVLCGIFADLEAMRK